MIVFMDLLSSALLPSNLSRQRERSSKAFFAFFTTSAGRAGKVGTRSYVRLAKLGYARSLAKLSYGKSLKPLKGEEATTKPVSNSKPSRPLRLPAVLAVFPF